MNQNLVTPGIYQVGAVDWNVRSFHGYRTARGTSYNAYLILDEKITLIDTVKRPFAKELLENISAIVDPTRIDYIISNHVEPDHSGALQEVCAAAPNATVITSDPNGLKGLMLHYGKDLPYRTVKSGDSLSLGKRTLTFVQTPMLHWPDSMVTYCPEEKLLFSNDAFGQHLAASAMFDDQNPKDVVMAEAEKYYANILMPFGAQVKKALSTVSKLELSLVAPAHGLIWRSGIQDILEKYAYFADDVPENRAVVVYDSMWGSTEAMARAIAQGFADADVRVAFYDLKENHISDIVTAVLKAKYIAVGSPTLNNNMMPNVSAFLTYLTGLSPKNKKAFAFGSYGWGGQSVPQIQQALAACKFEPLLEPAKSVYVPTFEDLQALRRMVKEAIL